MKNIHLPKDIKFYVFRKIFIRVFFFALLEYGVLWIIFTNSNHSIFENGFDNRTLLNFLLALLPCFITGVPLKLVDRSWHGEIIDTCIKQVRKFRMTGEFQPCPYDTLAIVGKIKLPNNSIIEKELKVHIIPDPRLEGECKYEKMEADLEHYQPGDSVYHLYGLRHFLIVRTRNIKIANCVVCGTENPVNNCVCRKCQYSLIKITGMGDQIKC